jgi:hypothetical protein
MLDGWGLPALPFADVAVTLCAIAIIAVSDRVIRRRSVLLS